jgi:NADPH:quinone reductase-like Zn-dependent oxidoreductase
MKAIIINETGGTGNFKIEEINKPEIKPGEVLVKVKAISINPVDAIVRKNRQALENILKPGKDENEFIIGWDISGTVVETGSEVRDIKTGDDVFGMVNFKGQGNAYAEYVAAPSVQLAIKPKNISHEEAAAATLAALTAWQALVTNAKVKKGEKVLIHAASGGVGHYAVQIAKYFDAYVIGTASSPNRDFALGLGADEFIDYNYEKFEEKIKDVDVVLDSIPGDHLARSVDAVKSGGRIVSIKGNFEGEAADKAKQKNIYTVRMMVRSNGNDMKQIAALLENGAIKSHVSKKYKFEQMTEAHKQIETGKTRGKIVVVV